MHVTCMSCNMHVACMENVPNPCMLHETCVIHACRYKWNLHITCAKISACHHLKYACNMHVTCTRFRIGMALFTGEGGRVDEINRGSLQSANQ